MARMRERLNAAPLDKEEFKPRFSDDHLLENAPPTPGEKCYLAWKKGGSAALTKQLLLNRAETLRNRRNGEHER